ncbi:MAG: hypothetical protein AB8U25_05585 [Rickettsiales endosymbiont of Dermacentor nuttalli]
MGVARSRAHGQANNSNNKYTNAIKNDLVKLGSRPNIYQHIAVIIAIIKVM